MLGVGIWYQAFGVGVFSPLCRLRNTDQQEIEY
jgi:hypothetical protein